MEDAQAECDSGEGADCQDLGANCGFSPEEVLVVGNCYGLVAIPIGDYDGYLAGQAFMAKLAVVLLIVFLAGLLIFSI